MMEWFEMGGYALYVWGSFGMTAACMVLEPIMLRRRGQQIRQQIVALQHQEVA